MTIIVDPPKGQSPSQPSLPQPQSPPSYAESAITHPLVVQPGTSGVLHAHGYGPTPIGQQQQATLPYYDPRSMHSVRAAKRRAKERFIGAVLWVLLIFALLSVFVWMGVRIQLGWSVSYCGLLRAGPHNPPLSHRSHIPLNACCLGYWLYRDVHKLITNTLFISKREAFGSLCAGGHKKGLFRQNHRERVVDHPDDRVELSRHTFFSLPVLLIPNDNNDHDLPLSRSVSFVHLRWTLLLWLLRFPIPIG